MNISGYWQRQLPHLKQLIRWDKPIGSLLLLWPVCTALWIASHGTPKASILLVFIAGVFIMRSAGCIMNDIADRKFDPHVMRTQNRPLATGQVSLLESLLLLFALLTAALLLLTTLNSLCFKLSWVALLLAAIYPFTKRWLPCPQLVLGLAFNWGIIMAFAAVLQEIPWTAWLLYTIAVVWTVAYDTIYSMVDQNDDQALGLKSSSILFGEHTTTVITWLYCIIIALLLILGIGAKQHNWYFIAVGCCCLHFIWQRWELKKEDPDQYFKLFLSNRWAWLLIFAGCFLSYGA